MRSKWDWVFFVVVMLFFGSCMAGMQYSVAKDREEFSKQCEARGGKASFGRGAYECLDPKLFR